MARIRTVSLHTGILTPAIESARDALVAWLADKNIPVTPGGDADIFIGTPDAAGLSALTAAIDRNQSRLPASVFGEPDAAGEYMRRPLFLLNENGEMDAVLRRADALERQKAIKQPLQAVATITSSLEELKTRLESPQLLRTQILEPVQPTGGGTLGRPARGYPKIFASGGFSIRDPFFDSVAKKTAALLAPRFDFVTGGNSAGVIHTFQKAAASHSAHVTGVVYPGFNTLKARMASEEFGISDVVAAPSVEDSIRIMAQSSKQMLVFPGGWGTDTEVSAVSLFKKDGTVPEDWKVIIMNLAHPETNERCHDTLIAELKAAGYVENRDFIVVSPPLMIDVNGLDLEASATLAAEMAAEALQPDKWRGREPRTARAPQERLR